jgi:glycosyltransferase involved in cell wall biosynthesis
VKLGIYYGTGLYWDGQNYYSHRPFGKYIGEISKRVEKVLLFVPVTQTNRKQKGYCMNFLNMEIIHLPYFTSYLSAVKIFLPFKEVFKRHIGKIDILWIRYPSPFTVYVSNLARQKNKKFFFEVTGDPFEVARKGTKYKGIFRVVALLYLKVEQTLMRNALRNTLVFTRGQELCRKYSRYTYKTVKTTGTTLSDENFFYREDTCQCEGETRVLYVGFLRHEKGLHYLLQSLKILREKKLNVRLTVIGDGPMKELLIQDSLRLNLGNAVDFKGYVSSEEELEEFYVRSDVFVLSSISEGTGRVLLEAMARGLPVVATNVGGIPGLIKHRENGYLVSAGDSNSLANAIYEIMRNGVLRRQMIKNGYVFASKHTLKHLVDTIFHYVEGELSCDNE